MFQLLCLCHTDAVHEDLNTSFSRSSINPQTFFKCLKLYLSMEEWFHNSNIKREVNLANSLVNKTLEMIQNVFPWWDKDWNEEGQGWAVSKFHGVTKFVLYMTLFGSAINFYGGIGECNHKKFAKDTGFNTQKRIKTFTSQVATRIYEGMILWIAKKCFDARAESNNNFNELSEQGDKSARRNYDFRGKYKLTFSGLEDMGIFMEYSVSNKKENPPLKCICGISVYAATQFHQRGMTAVTCYTSCNMKLENRNVTFCSTCNFWRGWRLVRLVLSRVDWWRWRKEHLSLENSWVFHNGGFRLCCSPILKQPHLHGTINRWIYM